MKKFEKFTTNKNELRNTTENYWSKNIPYINFPHELYVKIIPCNTMGIIRFLIKSEKMNNSESLCVHFSNYNFLGDDRLPYWEVFPLSNQAKKYGSHQIKEMLNDIVLEIKRIDEKKIC